jgi:ribokinase
MAKIVVLGSANADLYVELSRLPRVGETLPAVAGGELRPGGKGANTAAAASLLGAETQFLGQIGCDAAGAMLEAELGRRGVGLAHVVRTPATPSGQAIVMLLPQGQNSIVIVGGANQAWNTLPEAMLPAIRNAQAIMLQREVPDEVNLAAATAAKKEGKIVVLDAGGKLGTVGDEMLRVVDVLSPNEGELEEITGIRGDVEGAARRLIESGVKNVVVKMGGQGSMYFGEEGQYRQMAVSREGMSVVDTTGAGDCFTAALVTRLVERGGRCTLEDFKDAMAFASVAAFLSITKKGAMESMPRREDVDRF